MIIIRLIKRKMKNEIVVLIPICKYGKDYQFSLGPSVHLIEKRDKVTVLILIFIDFGQFF